MLIISFYSVNIDGVKIKWEMTYDDLQDAYWSEDADVPANDDPISDLYVDEIRVYIEDLKANPTFEDLIVLLGIDSYYATR